MNPEIAERAFKQFLDEPGGHALLRPDGTCVATGPQFTRMTYHATKGLKSTPVFEKFEEIGDNKKSAERMRASLKRVVQQGKPDQVGPLPMVLERPARWGGGTETRWWIISHRPLPNSDYIIERIEDVTISARLEERLQHERRRNRIRDVLALVIIVVVAYVGFHGQHSINNLARNSCRVQKKALPAQSALVGVIKDIDALITIPQSAAEKKAASRLVPRAQLHRQEADLHRLDRSLRKYVHLQSKVPSQRNCP